MEVAPGQTFLDNLNPNSMELVSNAYGEKSLAKAAPGDRFQFERLGYFVRDCAAGQKNDTANGGLPVFNKTVGLRDTWAKIGRKNHTIGEKV
jgi:glutaminyl-tRNA synthetase